MINTGTERYVFGHTDGAAQRVRMADDLEWLAVMRHGLERNGTESGREQRHAVEVFLVRWPIEHE